jgi:N-acyl-D-amino-acid deacylase
MKVESFRFGGDGFAVSFRVTARRFFMMDYVIKDLIVIDGTGKEGYSADLGIQDGRIAAIGGLSGERDRIIDGSGLVASPGFIDMHSHGDLEFFQPRPSEAKVRQGITTELLGQDGLGAAPVKEMDVEVLGRLLAGLNGILPAEEWTWRTLQQYLGALEGRALSSNVAVLLSHGPVRLHVMGMGERDATRTEMEAMKSLVREALRKGAFGFSTGLIYPPCTYGNTKELIELNREVSARDGIFVVHLRDEGYHLLRSLDEVLRISEESGVHLHISHFQAYGKVNWPLMDEALKRASVFLAKGGKITWDRYPYLAGSTVLTAVLPPWTFNEGPEALISNLKKPPFRARIHADFEKGLDVWHNRQISVGWENIIINAVHLEKNRWMQGKSCQAVADKLQKNPIDMVCDLLAEERMAVTMISFYGSEEVLDKVLTHSQATVGSDGIYGGRPHPRLYGTYPRFIQRYVREKKMLRLPDAIRKITASPAQILGLSDRGVIKEGYWADIVLFDPEKISDTATYESPENYPVGIFYVFVNGKLVVDQGRVTGAHPGRVLRK